MDCSLSEIRRRNETQQQQNSDRLSELPDALIIQILSLLEMKDSVKTGMLSKRWIHMWTQVDTIVYDFQFLRVTNKKRYQRKLQNVISFIDYSLMRCNSPKIRKFSLKGLRMTFLGVKCDNEMDDASLRQLVVKSLNDRKLFDKWISFVLTKNVECLKLKGIKCSAPDCLYRASSLVKLKINDVDLSVSLPVSWSSLKILHLSAMWLEDESVANIFLGCPVLESVTFSGVLGIRNLNIMSPNVKKLTILHTEYEDIQIEDDLNINAPWLEELVIRDSFFIPQTKLVNVSSLKKANIDFVYSCNPEEDFCYDESDGNSYGLWWNDMVYEIVRCVVQVDVLTLGSKIIRALAVSNLLGKPYPSFKCKHLMVTSPIWKNDLYPMACLLQNTPNLETLAIKVSNWMRYYISPYATAHFENKNLHLSLPNVKLAHLKKVQIEYVVEWDQKWLVSFDFELVEYVLKNASVLEKLVLFTTKYNDECLDCLCPCFCACQNAPRLSSKLLSNHLVGNNTGLEWDLKKRDSFFEFSFLNYEAAIISED